MEEVDNFQQEEINWWLWFAVLEAPDNEVLLYANLLRNTANFSPCIDNDKGELDVGIGKITYCSKIIDEEFVHDFMVEIDKNHNLKFGLLESSLNKEFLISATREIIDKTFGKSVVPIKSYYTSPDLTLWDNNLDDTCRSVVNA